MPDAWQLRTSRVFSDTKKPIREMTLVMFRVAWFGKGGSIDEGSAGVPDF